MSCKCLVSAYKLSKKSFGLECLCYIQKSCILLVLIGLIEIHSLNHLKYTYY
jgi:hypothetical protein